MFDFAQHGNVDSHRYRSHYDAQSGSTSKCSFCGRTIHYCYALKDSGEKTFLIGSCDFWRYKGTKTYHDLKAARTVMAALRGNMRHDSKYWGDRADVRESRKAWSKARRSAERHIRTWTMVKGEWLPKPLYDLREAAAERPRQYKRQSSAVRWYGRQAEKLDSLAKEVPVLSSTDH